MSENTSRIKYETFEHAVKLLDEAEREVKRLRVHLGRVKALATLWEEGAVQMEKEAGLKRDVGIRERAYASRSHAAALREMLGDD